MHNFTCPHCGKQIQAIPLGTTTPTTYKTFSSTTPWNAGDLPQSPGEWERRIPFRAPSLEHDILPVLAAAGVSGAFGLACSLTASGLTSWPWWAAVPVGLGCGAITWLVTFVTNQGTLYQVERYTSYEPEPAAAPRATSNSTVTIRFKETAGWYYRELPGEPKALQLFARKVLAGESFAERTCTNAGLTQQQYGQLVDIFISRGWAEWRNQQRKQQGVELRRNGRAVLRGIAAAPLPDDTEE